jgi:hypothetical protein
MEQVVVDRLAAENDRRGRGRWRRGQHQPPRGLMDDLGAKPVALGVDAPGAPRLPSLI